MTFSAARRMFEHVAELFSPVTQQAGKWLGESWEEIPAFVAFFLACFLAALAFWSRVVRLPLEKASLLSSCTMSLVHALVVDIVGYQLLQDWKTFDLDMANTPKQVGCSAEVVSMSVTAPRLAGRSMDSLKQTGGPPVT